MSFASFRPEPFFNRQNELRALERAWNVQGSTGQMVLLYGRRRLGKTYLLQRFFAGGVGEMPRPHGYYLADQTTAATQRLALARTLLSVLPDDGVEEEEIAVSWNALLRHVSAHCQQGERFGLILDEFPYLMEQSPELPATLQAWWDREGAHTRVFLVLCGSQLSAMASLGAESEPLFGRFNAGIMRLAPLRYDEVSEFYLESPFYGLLERLQMYGVFGGAPRYHALVDTSQPLEREVTDLLLRPGSPLENEVRFLLGSQHIRHPAPYNAILQAIAQGETQFGRIQQVTDIERSSLSFHLKTLLELGWIERELPFGETSERRALYIVADPFLAFWYRFVAPLSSVLQFNDPIAVYRERIAPYLFDYMGRYVFEGVCHQWLQRHARTRLSLSIQRMGRYWSRDGQTEIDIVAELSDGTYLFGECKWSANRPTGLSVLSALQAKALSLPEARYRRNPSFVLFTAGQFTPDLKALSKDRENRVFLISGEDLILSKSSPSSATDQ
ncbi:MAG: ATP-binding protein [Armatimonadetes bacterium]|nr:ATP-binding protein [Armatimonadota bacterium]